MRVTDYHVDFVRADGKVTSGPRIPFDWDKFDDAKKVAFVDSAMAAAKALNPAREYRVADAKERAPAQLFGLDPSGGGGTAAKGGGSAAASASGGAERAASGVAQCAKAE